MRLRSGFVACSVALLALAAIGGGLLAPVTVLAVDVGDSAPNFTLIDVDGATWSLSAARGDVVLLYFLGYNAEVCLQTARDIQDQFFSNYQSRGVDIFGIDCWDGTNDQLSRFRDEVNALYPMLLSGKDVAAAYELSYNSCVVIDGRGVVRYVSPGPAPSAFNPDAIARAVDSALSEANSTKLATWGLIKSLYTR